MTVTRFEQRLFTHHPFTINMVHHSAPIGDSPVPRAQPDFLVAVVLNPHMINPEPLPCLWLGLFWQEVHRDSHSDAFGNGSVLKQLFHSVTKVTINAAPSRASGRKSPPLLRPIEHQIWAKRGVYVIVIVQEIERVVGSPWDKSGGIQHAENH